MGQGHTPTRSNPSILQQKLLCAFCAPLFILLMYQRIKMTRRRPLGIHTIYSSMMRPYFPLIISRKHQAKFCRSIALGTPTFIISHLLLIRYHTSVEFENEYFKEDGVDKFRITAQVESLTATSTNTNKRYAKQRVAQLLLKKLHPTVSTWGQLTNMYCLHRGRVRECT